MKYLVNFLLIFLGLLVMWMQVTGGDQFNVFGHILGLRNPKTPTILLFLLSAVKLYKYSDFSFLFDKTRPYLYAIKGLLFFILTVLLIKTFVGLVTLYHFHLILDAEDWKHTYSTDLSFAFVALIALVILGWLARLLRWSKVMQVGFNLVFTAFGLVCFVFGTLYVLIGMTYFVWGSYIEPQHFAAMRNAGIGPESIDLLARWPTLIMVLFIYGLWRAAHVIGAVFQNEQSRGRWLFGLAALLIPAVLTAYVPITLPTKVAPSVQSPLLLFARPVSGNMNGIDVRYLLYKHRATPSVYQVSDSNAKVLDKYQHLEGIAKGKNVIYFVMESVRRQNLELYGYPRETMPTVKALAENALVFDQAYVMQPRSSKTMSALALGITPDPRLRPLSWYPERVTDKDNYFKRLMGEGRQFYIGTAQPYGGDNLQEFFSEIAGNKADVIISHEDLEKDDKLSNDDLGLVEHFSQWANANEDPFVGLLWTECAHIPYNAPIAPFGFRQLIDKYDNCLFSVDTALSNLVDNLKASGKLDDTLLVILGDHGEAMGEKFDIGHGNYLYEHSLRIPLIIYHPSLFNQRIDVSARFQLKDLASTMFYLLGMPAKLNQSINIFSKPDNETLFFSNVYQDFKMGFLEGQVKFVYRPTYDLVTIIDLDNDPQETVNIANQYSRDELNQMKVRSLQWYKFHTEYVDQHYPKAEAQ